MAGQVRMGSCCEEEDFVKSFVPSLFDSDSEAEDSFAAPPCSALSSVARLHVGQTPLHVHLGNPMKKTTSSEAFSRVQSYNKRPLPDLELGIKDDQPEASSPSSQGNSNTSSQTPFSSQLEHSDSMDSASPFYSVLSYESADTVFDFDPAGFIEEPPLKRQKVDSSAMMRHSPVSVSSTVTSPASFAMRGEASPACNMPTALSGPPSARLPPALPMRHSLTPQPSLAFSAGGITTGIPVDSCLTEVGRPSMGLQTMIPTSPANSFYPGHYGSHIPANLPAPVTSFEKIAAALAEVKRAPLTASPLGLKLDKSRLAAGLQALGMVLKE